MKVRTKIIVCFLPLMLVTLICLLAVVAISTNQLSGNITENMAGQLMSSRAEEVNLWLEMRIIELQKAAEYIEKTEDVEYYLDEENIAIIDETGYGWYNAQQILDVWDRKYFQEARTTNEKYLISSPVTSLIDGSRILALIMPVEVKNHRQYIVSPLDIGKLEDVISGIDLLNGIVWLMDSSGNIVVENQSHQHGETGCPRAYSLSALSQNMSEKKGEFQYALQDGTSGLMVYAGIENARGLWLCAWINNEDLYAGTRSVLRIILIIWSLALLACIILTYGLATSLTRPIRELQHVMDGIQRENLVTAIPIVGNDEIGQLGKSFQGMMERIDKLMQQITREQQEKRKAELSVLQSQINPHFLYNTLDMLRWQSLDNNVEEVSEVIMALSSFFRISLNGGKEWITLDQEAEHIYNYLFIQQKRFRDKLDFEINLNEEISDCLTIKLILQPLVENAINHGIKACPHKGYIWINIQPAGENIQIVVEDNGVGIQQDKREMIITCLNEGSPRSGYGLYNVHERIRLAYGKQYGVELKERSGGGTCVFVKIPRVQEELNA